METQIATLIPGADDYAELRDAANKHIYVKVYDVSNKLVAESIGNLGDLVVFSCPKEMIRREFKLRGGRGRLEKESSEFLFFEGRKPVKIFGVDRPVEMYGKICHYPTAITNNGKQKIQRMRTKIWLYFADEWESLKDKIEAWVDDNSL